MEFLKKDTGEVFIQTHDFPDPDAVASAYALASLLKKYDIKCELFYHGFIQRLALNKLIASFEIPLRHASSYLIQDEDKIIVVDGNTLNRNIRPSGGEVIAVVDHHQTEKEPEINFCDIRPDYGSCSSIITEYWMASPFEPDISVATSLMIGIARDTDNFKRMVSRSELQAFQNLWPLSDPLVYYSIIRNNIESKDRVYYRRAMNLLEIEKKAAYLYFDEGCPLHMMGILGDFLLSMNDVNFTYIAARNGENINISVRSESLECSASDYLILLLEGVGWGGGHKEMAGGILPLNSNVTHQEILDRMKSLLGDKLEIQA